MGVGLKVNSMHLSLRKAVTAVIPALGTTLVLKDAFQVGALICSGYWLTSSFFFFARSWFPGKTWNLCAFLIWMTAFAQIGWYLSGIHPIWIVSLILLSYDDLNRESDVKSLMKEAFTHGFCFWAMLIYLGASQQFLGDYLSLGFFQNPSGAFLLLAVAAAFWKNQPRSIRA